MSWKYYAKSILAAVLLFASCERGDIQPENNLPPQSDKSGVRFRVSPGTYISNIHVYAFQVTSPGDTVFVQALPTLSGAAVNSPAPLNLPMGNYVLVALGNVDSRIVTPVVNVTKMGDLMATLTANATFPSYYNQAGEWFWGIDRDVNVGTEASVVMDMKRLVGKVVLEYKHADAYMTQFAWKVDGLSQHAYFNGNFTPDQGTGIGVFKQSTSFSGNVLSDSVLVFPTVNSSSTLYLTHTRTIAGQPSVKNYTTQLSTPVRSNYITRITVNGGESTTVSVNEMPWTKDTATIILDESPNSGINLGIGDFTTSGIDTSYLQSVDIRVTVNLGVPANYTGSFNFKINKLAPTTGTLTKNVAMKIVNGKLMTTTPIKLSRGTYTLTNYYLSDVEGALPDPAGKAVAKNFQVALNYQLIDVTLDGRQAVDNALLVQIVDTLHGTGQTTGSIFPGTSLFAQAPLGTTLPPTVAGIAYSNWYASTNPNSYVQQIPLRGEWRAYSLVYRGIGSATKLNGKLPSQLNQLKQLTVIDFSYNALTGVLPTFTGLTLLNNILLNNNGFSGTIDNLGPLTNLTRVSLENNTFSGTITTGLTGSANKLTYVSLNSNSFTGSPSVIPLSVGSIFLQRNQFSGQLGAYNALVAGITAQCDLRYNKFICYSSSISSSIAAGRVNPQTTGNISTCP